MRKYYPELVEAYEESIKKPVKEKKTRGRKKNDKKDVDVATVDVNKSKKKQAVRVKNKIDKNGSQNASLTNVSVCVNKLKRKLKAKKGQKTIDGFIANKRRKSNRRLDASSKMSSKTSPVSLDSLSTDEAVKGSNKVNDNAYNADVDSDEENHENKQENRLSMLNATDNNDDTTNASDIVESILHRNIENKFAKFNNRIYKLVYEKNSTPKKTINSKCVTSSTCRNCSTPTESPIRRPSFKNIANISNRSYDKVNESYKNIPNCSVSNTSYFFDKLTDDRDAFELSMDSINKYKSAGISISRNSTIDYSLPDVQL